jgi:hypothetical protein
MIDEICAITTSNGFDFYIRLCLNHCAHLHKFSWDLLFVMKSSNIGHLRVIIEESEDISFFIVGVHYDRYTEACQTHLNPSELRKRLDRQDRDDTQQVDKQQEGTNKQPNLSPIRAAFSCT